MQSAQVASRNSALSKLSQRQQILAAKPELLQDLVSAERWDTESATLPEECQPLSLDQEKFILDMMELLSERKESTRPSTLVAFLRAYENDSDARPSKTAQLLREALEIREAHARMPPMEPKTFAACRRLWPRCVSGFDWQGHCVIWD